MSNSSSSRSASLDDEEQASSNNLPSTPTMTRTKQPVTTPGTMDLDDDEINNKTKQDFEDLAATGKWGSVSRKEVIVVVISIVLVLLAVVAVVVVLVVGSKNKQKNSRAAGALNAFSESPSMAPSGPVGLFASPLDEYMTLVQALHANPYTKQLHMPGNSSDLRAQSQFENNAFISAAAWLMFKDPTDIKVDLTERFAILTLYYAWTGDEWLDHTKWLSPLLHVCEWKGVLCDPVDKKVVEVNLPYNRLVGSIPETLSMLQGLTALRIGHNDLTGTIPGSVLGSLQKLTVLELHNNFFTGELPKSTRGPELTNLSIQGTMINGTWPFCKDPVKSFTMNCSMVSCACCDAVKNCVG
jgi:hypothetical protein